MKRCIIFCAGEFHGLALPVGPEDLVIAADGGYRHTQALGIKPDVILGDFDSLGHVPAGAEVFPVEKDDTDAMLAVRRGLALGCREFYLYGTLEGPRLDHTVANFQTLQYLADRGAVGYLVGGRETVTVVKDGALCFPAQASGCLSVFCLGADARGVAIRGAKYELEDGALTAGFPLGVSNRFVSRPVTVRVAQGSLTVIWQRENGFPAREK